jgi:hypothetical protein
MGTRAQVIRLRTNAHDLSGKDPGLPPTLPEALPPPRAERRL